MDFNYIRKPFKVEFLYGRLNGAIRYYSDFRSARSVARRYVNRPVAGCMFSYPTCVISYITPQYRAVFLEEIH